MTPEIFPASQGDHRFIFKKTPSLLHDAARPPHSRSETLELTGVASILLATKSRMVQSTRWGRSIGAVCDALGISSSSAPGIAAAIALPLSGGVKPSRAAVRVDAGHTFEVRHEVGGLDQLAANLEASRDLVGEPCGQHRAGHAIDDARRAQDPLLDGR
jgi:hypothetical protein